MSNTNIRVRFAPSPTGPLHMGGVRTALYNYLFAKANGGTFILRIEDTDQTRFVDGAQEYVMEALKWCGLKVDEGVQEGGDFGPYKQSLRSNLYEEAVRNLLKSGNAYRAFDTPEELDTLRKEAEKQKLVFQYDADSRGGCRNDLSLDEDEVQTLLKNNSPYVIRFKTPDSVEEIKFVDEIRGEISFSSRVVDDKVLMKTDGLPTYHLANVIDDHYMEISHVIRGEEWLPSTPLHVLLYRALDWETPKFAHLPLILKPEGNGKLSKRDGDEGGFPVFPISWTDKESLKTSEGYMERGYLPEAFINMLLMLGWNPGDEREMFSIEEAANAFSLDRIVKSGARFSPDKAKWFNENYLRIKSKTELVVELLDLAKSHRTNASAVLILGEEGMTKIITLMIDRVSFLHEILDTVWLFQAPKKDDFNRKMIRKKWKPETSSYLEDLKSVLTSIDAFNPETIEQDFKKFLDKSELGFGQVLLPFRIALTGVGGGPSMFEFAAFLGKEQTISRLEAGAVIAEEILLEEKES